MTKQAQTLSVFFTAAMLAAGCGGTANRHSHSGQQAVSQSASQPAVDQAQVPKPNPSLTPGAAFANATPQRICQSGYARSVRDVSPQQKRQVYDEYGIPQHTPGQYEVDHLISLELGGSNDTKNLWPEPYNGPAGAHEKDGLENYLHGQVCSARLPLAQAQQQIARDWYAAWLQAGRPMPTGGGGQ